MATRVIAALRTARNHPIRRRVLAWSLAAAALSAAALLPLLADAPDDEGRSTGRGSSSQALPAPDRAAATTSPPLRQQSHAPGLSSQRRVARQFLSRYLAYTYGQAGAGPLRDLLHPGLWRELAARPPHVPHGIHELTPRLSYLRLTPSRAGDANVEAFVDDGSRRYFVSFVLAPAGSHWRVTAIGHR